MSTYSEYEIKRIFDNRIGEVDTSQEQIEGFTNYIFLNESFLNLFVEVFSTRIQNINPAKEQYQSLEKYLFMLNDIIQRSRFTDLTIFRAFSPIIEKLIIKIAQTKEKGLLIQGQNIINLFETRKIYDKSFISRLQVQLQLHQDENEESKISEEFLNLSDEASKIVEEIQKLDEENVDELSNHLKKLENIYKQIIDFHSNGIKKQRQIKAELEDYSLQMDAYIDKADTKIPIYQQQYKVSKSSSDSNNVKYPYV